jgi:hypothetical protein
MRRNMRIFALVALVAVSAFGQDRSLWRTAADVREGSAGTIVGTVVDVDEARGRLQVQPDEDRYQRLTVMTDSVSTQYNGFGGMINDAPEIYRGSKGFANIREGDRLQIAGAGRATAVVMADQITLLGRQVEASQVGVGETRTGTSISTPTATSTVPATVAENAGFAEGTVRQVNAADGRLVIQTPQRRMITVRANRSTPVYYRGEVYRINNLEIGDYVRVEADARGASADEVTARSIEVTQSVQESSSRPADQRLTTVVGRVTRVERTADIIRVDTGRADVRVDMVRAVDSTGRRLRAADLEVGDRVDITGSYSSNSDVFLASTVRFEEGSVVRDRDEDEGEDEDREDREPPDYVTVTISGTVTESLRTSPTLVIRDRAGRTVELYVTEDFIYRTKAGGYATADKLNNGDAVLVKAFRDEDENLIAQSIRIR